MNTEYIQNLRYKLQKCVRRLNSMVQQTFHFSLKQFQGFLKSYPIFVGILEHINRQEGEQIKMQEEDRNRYKILIAGGTEVFERLEENIFNLNTRNITLSGIILATVSIFLTQLLFLRHMEIHFSTVDWILIYIFLLLSVISLVMTLPLLIPTKYKDIDIFKEKRFAELSKMDEETLFKDFLFNIKKSYSFNIEKIKNRMRWFNITLSFFITADITFITFVFKNILWG